MVAALEPCSTKTTFDSIDDVYITYMLSKWLRDPSFSDKTLDTAAGLENFAKYYNDHIEDVIQLVHSISIKDAITRMPSHDLEGKALPLQEEPYTEYTQSDLLVFLKHAQAFPDIFIS